MRNVAFLLAFVLTMALASGCRREPRLPVRDVFGVRKARAEFYGPFADWANLKTRFGAAGDGRQDDTFALERAIAHFARGDTPRGSLHVLYVPAGTYRITHTIRLGSVGWFSIVGEDPARTVFLWDGPRGGDMFRLNGASYGQWKRLTFEGAGRASAAIRSAWDGQVWRGPVFNEYSDDVFRDLRYGIRAGSDGEGTRQDSESDILRSRFIHCATGVSVESFNALDWWIWYSRFEHCGKGVSNTPGAGDFFVYRSFFEDSSIADVAVTNSETFALRENTSVGSRRFFDGTFNGYNAGPEAIEGNRIYDTASRVAIHVGNEGALMLLDNVIRSGRGVKGPVAVVASMPGEGALLSVGNTFTSPHPLEVSGGARLRSLDDRIVPRRQVEEREPLLPSTPEPFRGPVMEIPAGLSMDALQTYIDRAAALHRPVILHFPQADYVITRPLTVPAGAPIAFAGDNPGASRLVWRGRPGGTLFQLDGPSRASFSELGFDDPSGSATLFNLTRADQQGARVTAREWWMDEAGRCSLDAGPLRFTRVELEHFTGVSGSDCGIRSTGAGPGSRSQVSVFGGTMNPGSGAETAPVFDVRNGGRLLVVDSWFEGRGDRYLDLDRTSGALTFQDVTVHPYAPRRQPEIQLSDFTGKLSLLGDALANATGGDAVTVGKELPTTRVLVLGSEGSGDPPGAVLTRRSGGGRVAALLNSFYFKQAVDAPGGAQGAHAIQESDDIASNAFLLSMLKQLRSTHPVLPTPLPAGITDVRFHRIYVARAGTGLRISGTPNPEHSDFTGRNGLLSAAPGLPRGWWQADIGQPGLAGDVRRDAPFLAVGGSGQIGPADDVRVPLDQFHFVFRRVHGDAVLIARFMGMRDSRLQTRAGLALRASLSPDAPEQLVAAGDISTRAPGAYGLIIGRRASAGQDAEYTNKSQTPTLPVWLRIRRRGNRVSLSWSPDGETWTVLHRTTLVHFPPSADLGFFIASDDNQRLSTARFDQLTLNGRPLE